MARSKGKYADVIAGLPRTFGKEPEYQVKVQAVKDAMAANAGNLRPAALAEEYAAARDEKTIVEGALSEVNLRIAALEQLMIEQFDAEKIEALRTEQGLISVLHEPSPQIVDKEAYRQWCDADPDLRTKMMLWPTTTAALAKERLRLGEPNPPGVEIEVIRKVRFTKA